MRTMARERWIVAIATSPHFELRHFSCCPSTDTKPRVCSDTILRQVHTHKSSGRRNSSALKKQADTQRTFYERRRRPDSGVNTYYRRPKHLRNVFGSVPNERGHRSTLRGEVEKRERPLWIIACLDL